MRERKYVKFRVDMYDDTKFKIIDMKPERDLIHYVWTRVVTLAGKVNLDGDLYMSRNIPYTIETLAIEFNRSEEQIKLALDIFIELEMIELIESNIYRIKNFSKHQNIKVKEKINSEDKENNVKNIDVTMKETSKNEVCGNEEKESGNKVDENKEKDIISNDKRNTEITSGKSGATHNISSESIMKRSQYSSSMLLDTKRNKTSTKNKKKDGQSDISDEDVADDNVIGWFTDGDLPVNEGDRVIMSMTF